MLSASSLQDNRNGHLDKIMSVESLAPAGDGQSNLLPVHSTRIRDSGKAHTSCFRQQLPFSPHRRPSSSNLPNLFEEPMVLRFSLRLRHPARRPLPDPPYGTPDEAPNL